jgi:hypothetical protein
MSYDSHDLPDPIRTEMDQEDAILSAVYEFNRKPTRGVAHLCRAHNVDPTPKNIAELLHNVPGLVSQQVGEYLSQREQHETLKCYFLQLDLRHPFLVALREALSSSLNLPSEGDQIDRIVQTWAECWVIQNASSCRLSGDQAYILAFAAVLLNSDLHNPSVTRKMTVREFIENVRGAISPDTIGHTELFDLYTEIRNEEFRYRRSEGDEIFAMAAPKLRGTLQRRRDRLFNPWASYYFVLTDGCLCYFKDSRGATVDAGPLGVIQLVSVNVQPVGTNRISVSALQDREDIQFVRFKKRRPSLVKGTRTILLRAETEAARDKWLYRMRTTCVYSGFRGGEPGQSEGTSGSDITPPPAMPDEGAGFGCVPRAMSTTDNPSIAPSMTLSVISPLARVFMDDGPPLDNRADGLKTFPSSSCIHGLEDKGTEWVQLGVDGSPPKQPEDDQ